MFVTEESSAKLAVAISQNGHNYENCWKIPSFFFQALVGLPCVSVLSYNDELHVESKFKSRLFLVKPDLVLDHKAKLPFKVSLSL